jgi:hypothetical protein
MSKAHVLILMMVSLVALASSRGSAEEIATILVFPIEIIGLLPDDEETIPPTMGAVLTDEVQMALMEMGGVKAVTLTNLESQLEKVSTMEVLECEGEECLKKVTDNFGLAHNLFGKVTRMNDKLHVVMTWTSDDEVVEVQTGFCAIDADSLITQVKEVARELFASLAPTSVGSGPSPESLQPGDTSEGHDPEEHQGEEVAETAHAPEVSGQEMVDSPAIAVEEEGAAMWIMAPQFTGFFNLAHEQIVPGTELALGLELAGHHILSTSVSWGLTQRGGVSTSLLGVGLGYSYELVFGSYVRLELGGIVGYFSYDVDIGDDPEASSDYDAALFVLLRPTLYVELGHDKVFASLGPRIGIGGTFVPGFTVGLGFRL